MRVVYEAIRDGVSEGICTNAVVPLRSWQLADKDRRAFTMTIIEYLPQIMPVFLLKWL